MTIGTPRIEIVGRIYIVNRILAARSLYIPNITS